MLVVHGPLRLALSAHPPRSGSHAAVSAQQESLDLRQERQRFIFSFKPRALQLILDVFPVKQKLAGVELTQMDTFLNFTFFKIFFKAALTSSDNAER